MMVGGICYVEGLCWVVLIRMSFVFSAPECTMQGGRGHRVRRLGSLIVLSQIFFMSIARFCGRGWKGIVMGRMFEWFFLVWGVRRVCLGSSSALVICWLINLLG